MGVAEEQIRRAMEEGRFDDLPGKGKPLNLDENPFEDPELRLAHKLLKDGGFTLPWIEKRKEIEERLTFAVARLEKAWSRCGGGAPVDANVVWEQAVAAFRAECGELNKMIFSYNLEAPVQQVQRLAINADKLVQKVCSSSG